MTYKPRKIGAELRIGGRNWERKQVSSTLVVPQSAYIADRQHRFIIGRQVAAFQLLNHRGCSLAMNNYKPICLSSD